MSELAINSILAVFEILLVIYEVKVFIKCIRSNEDSANKKIICIILILILSLTTIELIRHILIILSLL